MGQTQRESAAAAAAAVAACGAGEAAGSGGGGGGTGATTAMPAPRRLPPPCGVSPGRPCANPPNVAFASFLCVLISLPVIFLGVALHSLGVALAKRARRAPPTPPTTTSTTKEQEQQAQEPSPAP